MVSNSKDQGARTLSNSPAHGPLSRAGPYICRVSFPSCFPIKFCLPRKASLPAQSRKFLFWGYCLYSEPRSSFPFQLVESRAFTIILLLIDTAITSSIIYATEQLGSDLYLAYFLIILISASMKTLRLKILCSSFIAVLYGVIFYLSMGSMLFRGRPSHSVFDSPHHGRGV